MAATRRAFFHCGVDGIARAAPGEAALLPQVGGRRAEEGASSMIFGFPMPVVPGRPAAVTQQFFPATAAPAPAQQQATEEQWQCHVPAGCSAAEQWVRSASRKSRRGPRSRSSQYRGVTFYRRTGRWESHIWSVTCCTPAVQCRPLNLLRSLLVFSACASNLHFLFYFMLVSVSLVSLAGTVGSRCTWVSSCPIGKNRNLNHVLLASFHGI